VVLTVTDQAGNIATDTMTLSISSSEIDPLLAIGLLSSLVTIGLAVAFLLRKKGRFSGILQDTASLLYHSSARLSFSIFCFDFLIKF